LAITPLYEEASSGEEFIDGHGVSYLIRTDAATVLLDVGNNPDASPVPPFIRNMEALGVDAGEIDAIVITHPHPDHVGGQEAWRHDSVSLGESPGALGDLPVYVPVATGDPDAVLSTAPTAVALDVGTTGVLPYVEVFPLSLFEATGSEQALVIHVANEGLVLVTGCGHPGLTNLVIRAEALYQEPVVGVVGGLHYGDAKAEDVAEPIAFLQSRGIRLVAMSPHDSGPDALTAFLAAFGDRYHTLRIGETVRFP
jgi:7,8-dihydropterin-6-yl-methyl-4-(beta-D-ribofuranosyl)aminobenzene 5'-phosphate synthase